jgi:hypothetical protein
MAIGWSRGTPNDGDYLWVRPAADGSVYASRVEPTAVVIDHFSVPGRLAGSIWLPFSVNPNAPAGFCPIDGYLASFSIGAEGMVLVTHRAGPLDHSCPPPPRDTTTSEDTWRCRSPEAVGFEQRSGSFTQPSHQLGMSIGRSAMVAADSLHNSTLGWIAGNEFSVMRIGGPPPDCCFGGQTGVAFAISPDGQRLAYSPDGHALRVTGVQPGGQSGQTLWASLEPVETLAWGDGWIVAAHRGGLTYVGATGQGSVNVPVSGMATVVTMAAF